MVSSMLCAKTLSGASARCSAATRMGAKVPRSEGGSMGATGSVSASSVPLVPSAGVRARARSPSVRASKMSRAAVTQPRSLSFAMSCRARMLSPPSSKKSSSSRMLRGSVSSRMATSSASAWNCGDTGASDSAAGSAWGACSVLGASSGALDRASSTINRVVARSALPLGVTGKPGTCTMRCGTRCLGSWDASWWRMSARLAADKVPSVGTTAAARMSRSLPIREPGT